MALVMPTNSITNLLYKRKKVRTNGVDKHFLANIHYLQDSGSTWREDQVHRKGNTAGAHTAIRRESSGVSTLWS